jgi:hypothetical protein
MKPETDRPALAMHAATHPDFPVLDRDTSLPVWLHATATAILLFAWALAAATPPSGPVAHSPTAIVSFNDGQ